MKEYKTILKHSTGMFSEKKSKFIANIVHVETSDAADKFIAEARAKYWDAKHNVYAYIIRDGNLKKYSDDGEPQGTSGLPSLKTLEGAGLSDICVVITRYFGGTLLGTGGLVRAYSTAVKSAIENSEIVTAVNCSKIIVEIDYAMWNKVEDFSRSIGACIDSTEYSDNVRTVILVPEGKEEKFASGIMEKTDGKVKYKCIGNCILYMDTTGKTAKYSN